MPSVHSDNLHLSPNGIIQHHVLQKQKLDSIEEGPS